MVYFGSDSRINCFRGGSGKHALPCNRFARDCYGIAVEGVEHVLVHRQYPAYCSELNCNRNHRRGRAFRCATNPFFVCYRSGADTAKRAHIISEMNRSVKLLGEVGTKDWDLPRLHDFDNDDDSSADDSDDSTSDDQSSDAMDSSNGSGDSSPSSSSGGSSSLRVEPGWFIVFALKLSNNNSLEVAKIVSVDLSAGDHGEVTVHWYTPSRRKNCSRAMYGRGVWSADYVVMQDNKRVGDLGTEPIDLACCTFRALNKSQKLPFGLWAVVERRVPTDGASLSEGGGV